MIIEDVSFELKDGRKALLRSANEGDIEGMLNYLRISAEETPFVIRYPEECDKYTYEDEKVLFEQWNASPNEAMIICLVDGHLAGNCMIVFNDRIKTRHRANVMIALTSAFWNLGIGTRMFEEMIRIARERQDVLQLELGFVENNSRARALYEKMGFRITGIQPNAFRLKDGTMLNEYIMVKVLE